MVLVIDASNIQTGGGMTHLTEILRNVDAQKYGFKKVIICASESTLHRITDRDWLLKYSHPYLNRSYFHRALWTNFILLELLKYHNGFLFLLGSIKPNFRWPHVTICQNLLPLELKELRRFGFSRTTLRLVLLRWLHLNAYANSEGVIFLTQYSFDVLPLRIKKRIKSYEVIPHGINHELFKSMDRPPAPCHPPRFSLLYISIINVYKHQYNVAKAVIEINRKGFPLRINLVGPAYGPSLTKLRKLIKKESASDFINYKGPVAYSESSGEYEQNDAFIFASSCETFGMILTEAIAIGIPIACSDRSSLPETMQDVPVYFDPEDVGSIEKAILKLMQQPELRAEISAKGLKRAQSFDWQKCANATFGYLSEIALKRKLSSIQYHDTEAGAFQAKYLYRRSFQARLQIWNQLIYGQGIKVDKSMDIGCGPGWMTQTLCDISREVVAIDGSERMIDSCRKLLETRTNIQVNQLEITPALFRKWTEGTFDLIIMSSVLEYLEDPEEILEQTGLLLSQKGRLIFSIPNRDSLFRKIEYQLNRWIGIPPYRSLIRNSWSRKETLRVLEKMKFHATKIIFQGEVPIYSQLFIWLPRRFRNTMMIVIASK